MQNTPKKEIFNVRVDRNIKAQAELVAETMGISLASAVNMFLSQFAHDGGMPFTPTIKTAYPARIQTKAEFEAAVREGYEDGLANPISNEDHHAKTKEFLSRVAPK
jgi:addiction module RelB/DinJ family antitoxin